MEVGRPFAQEELEATFVLLATSCSIDSTRTGGEDQEFYQVRPRTATSIVQSFLFL